MNRRYLLVVRAGETSLHRSWLAGGERDFDLLVSYYGSEDGKYRADGEHYHVMAGPRWPAHDEICRTQAALIGNYDYVCFACDDLEAATETWNRLFAACRRYQLDLAQPAILGFVSYGLTRPHRGCRLRFTNFVEVMCPVFSRATLQLLSHTFSESVSGWGLSVAWWSHLKAAGRVGIIDAVRVRHGRPVGEGTLYGLLAKMGVDATGELASVKEKYASTDFVARETGRVMTPLHRIFRRLVPAFYAGGI